MYNKCDKAMEQLYRIAKAELEPLYQAIKDQKKRNTNNPPNKAMEQLARIAKEDLKGLEKLINERKNNSLGV